MLLNLPNLSASGLPLLLQFRCLVELRLWRGEFVTAKAFEQSIEFVFIPELLEVYVERGKHLRIPRKVELAHAVIGNRKLPGLPVCLEIQVTSPDRHQGRAIRFDDGDGLHASGACGLNCLVPRDY